MKKETSFWDELDASAEAVEEAALGDVVGHARDWDAFAEQQVASHALPTLLEVTPAVSKSPSRRQNASATSEKGEQNDEESAALKGEIEALLFMTSRPLPMEELALMLDAPLDDIVDALSELLNDYAFRGESSLEIEDSEEGYILQVRLPYKHLVNKMIPMEMSAAALRTLSVIAIKSPLLQKELIDLRGSSAYDHVKELLAHKLISKNRHGSSYRLNVTSTFHQLFKLTGDKKDLDVLVDSELGLEREARQKALNAPLEALPELEDTPLNLSL
jgi:segregation and condensation protein B